MAAFEDILDWDPLANEDLGESRQLLAFDAVTDNNSWKPDCKTSIDGADYLGVRTTILVYHLLL